MQNRFAAADAMLTLDVTSGALAWAVAHKLPTIALSSSIAAESKSALQKGVRFTIPPRVSAWAEQSFPLIRFRAWPLGLFQALEPAAGQDTPYLPIELLDEEGFLVSVQAYLFDASERKRAKADMDMILKSVQNLPSGGDLWEMMAAE